MKNKYALKTKSLFAILGACALLASSAAIAAPDSEGSKKSTVDISAYANKKPVENFELSEDRIVGGISFESGAKLMDPVKFDFNGDGIDDIIFGAPGMSPQGVANAGSVYVKLGRQGQELTGRQDMTLWHSYDYRFDGSVHNGMLGLNIVNGDFNGDGILDVAIAEPGQSGRIYIVYGGNKLEPGNYMILDERVTNVYFAGTENDSNLGIQMCVADFNHDDIDDIAASYMSDTSASALTMPSSNVVLLAMRRSWDNRYHSLGDKLYGKTIFSRSVARNVRAVHTCAAGDFDDDGLVDLALGMPLDSFDGLKSAGSVSVIYYPFKYSGTTINLSETDPKWGIRIKGSQNGAMFGYSMTAGEFTGDGRTDLAVSSPARVIKSAESEGAVFVLDASKWPKRSGVQSEELKIAGQGGMFGMKLQTHDVNGDNRDDLVVSAPYAKAFGGNNAGTLNVYLGGPHFVESVKSEMRADIQLNGDLGMNLGFGATFGDFNADGKIDAAVRVAQDPNGRPNTGSLAVFSDVQQSTPDTHLADLEFLTIVAPAQGGGLSPRLKNVQYAGKNYDVWLSEGGMGSRSVICMMDTQNEPRSAQLYTSDSCDINIIGPENATIRDILITSNNDQSKYWLTISLPSFELSKSKGVVSVIELPSSISKPLTLNLTEKTLASEAVTFVLEQESDSKIGEKIDWVDLAGDGNPDLIIGAPERSIEQNTAGSVFIVKDVFNRKKGKYELTSATGVTTIEGIEDEKLGSQWQVLDFNLDGKLDIAILAENTKNTNLEVLATVYVIYGAGDLIDKEYTATSPEIAPLKVVAPMSKAGLKIISQNVDLNRDGNNDLLLLSPDYRAGLQRQGAIYALYASTERKSGSLSLSNSALVNFSLVSNRNEKLSDYRFVRHNGVLQLLVLNDSMLSKKTTLRRYVTEDVNIFSGQVSSAALNRVAPDVALAENATFVLQSDSSLQEDTLWLLFPYAGESQSGQGIAHKVSLDP